MRYSCVLSAMRAALLLFVVVSVSSGQVLPTRIMPLGDSITNGSPVPGGYRNRLYQILTAVGYNVDFVGNQTSNSVGTLPDSDHEGHGGWRIDQLDANIIGWLATIEAPDVVLVHIGTNDFGQNNDIANAIDRLDALITKIALAEPTAHIIVSNLMERNEPHNTNIQTLFNPFVEDRVNAQAALGRNVTFLDMRSAVPLSDMPDNLHPNQTGYDKMADAWLPAIQAVVQPEVDDTPPTLVSAAGNLERTQVAITFSKPVADSATNLVNYAISGGLTVTNAQLDATKEVITLGTTLQAQGVTYTITVNGITDRVVPTPNAMAPNSTIDFMGVLPRGYLHRVAESAEYSLVYSIDLANSASYQNVSPPYAIDRHLVVGPFSRVAYYLELQKPGEALEYVWASMDAFTDEAGQIGIPTLVSGATFQQPVTNLNLHSNVSGLDTGTNLVGNIEFWPTNYQGANEVGVPGAGGAFDFGDRRSAGTYGSMQVHHTTAGQTAFAFNRWGGSGGNHDLGIGNNPNSANTDWTFEQNAADYAIKTLQVLVYTGGDTNAPELVSAEASFGRTFITVRFSEPLAPGSVRAENFTLDHGVHVLGVTLAEDLREVRLDTTVQPEGTSLTLTVNDVRDASPCANPIDANSTIPVALAALPPEIVANIGGAADGYELVCTAVIPDLADFNTVEPYTYDDRDAAGTFSRVAYYLELQRLGGPVEYIWTAMDAFTIEKSKIAIPTFASGAVFQQNVSNLDVISNVSGVTNGLGMAGGNIEFWPNDYGTDNVTGVPNASGTTFDFGDLRRAGGGHGSMQVHNHATNITQTLFAMNSWGPGTREIALGIGNRPSGHPDWTFADNADDYIRKVLHVLVLPAAPAVPPLPEVVANVPDITNYQYVATLDIPANGNRNSSTYLNDIRDEIGPFSRVAYYMELTTGTETNWIWTAMDAFTSDPGRIGLPTVASGAIFQQPVFNLDVLSNVAGITNGTNMVGGNMEFWPSNYNQQNSGNVPNASASAYDFGDNPTAGDYGSMQVHNHIAQQTLFAFNRWGGGGGADRAFCLGIGNRPGSSDTDWTHANNGASYSNRVLHIFVEPGYGNTDTNGPVAVAATGSPTLDRLVVSFDEALADTAADPTNYTIADLTVTSASLGTNQMDVLLATSPQLPGTNYTVMITGVRDRSLGSNLIAPGASVGFTAFESPAVLTNVAEIADYDLIYELPMPNAVRYNTEPVPYTVDESRFPQYTAYDRTAYLLELETAVTSQWVYVSSETFTPLVSQMGVPTWDSGAIIQQNLTNLNVYSSSGSGITNGLGITTGNIEFWPSNYSAPNSAGIPGTTSTTVYDWGDTRSGGGNYGSMQVHNHGALQTIFAYNNWGGNGGNSAIGIGNDPAPVNNGLDWTFHQNAATYTVKNLYVLARPSGSDGSAPTILAHPVDRAVLTGEDACFAVNVLGAGPYAYQWRLNGAPLAGATESWLTVPAASAADEGDYDVVVTALGGAVTTSLPGNLLLIDINHAPTFAGYRITTRRNTAKAIAQASLLLKADDVDLDPISLAAVDGASMQGGSIASNAVEIVYAPALDFVGADRFDVVLIDGQGGSVTGAVQVTVTTVNTMPSGDGAIDVQTSGETSVLFIGNPGQTYEIQRASSLLLADWQTIQVMVAGDDGLLVFTDPAPPSIHAVYRSKTTAP